MKALIWIPDIEDNLARSKYPWNLTNFQVRITQSIVRNDIDRIFASSSQKEHFKTLELFYRDLLLKDLIIHEEQIEFIETQEKEFLTDAILKKLGIKELKELLNWKTLEPYVNTKNSDKISEISWTNILRDSNSSKIINDKAIAQKELWELWVLVPEWKEINTKKDAINYFIYLKEKWYREVSFKRKDSINWLWVFKASNLDDFQELIHNNIEVLEKWVLIDWWIDWKIASPNIQYFVWKRASEDKLIACSDQILVDEWKEHIWNISDENILSDEKLTKDVQTILNWIRSKKWYWVVWLDFLTTKNWNYFIEINWRYNWSTHWAVIANKIWKKYWITHDWIRTPEKDFLSFAWRLDSNKQLYKDWSWVIPVNPATLESWKAMIVIVWDSKTKINTILNNLIENEW